jgi:ABC-type nitrate/sulfonate/bicarbonate transport system permease component
MIGAIAPSAATVARRGANKARRQSVLVQGSVFVAIIVIWEAAARSGLVHPFLLPPFTEVVKRLFDDCMEGLLPMALAATAARCIAGFALACVVAVPLGLAMSQFRAVRWFFDPLLSIGFPMPKVAFLPIFILWFDVFDTSKVLMAAFSCSFTILSATYAGAGAVERTMIWSAKSLGVGRVELLWSIVLPAALPRILTGFQIAFPLAMISTVVAEMYMGGVGVGGSMMMAGRFADSVGVYSGIIAVGLLGFVLIKGLEFARRRLLVWHAEERRS